MVWVTIKPDGVPGVPPLLLVFLVLSFGSSAAKGHGHVLLESA